MTYHYPQDPRPLWEWCPKCEAWYEINRDEYARPPLGRPHDHQNETRLTDEDVRAASQLVSARLGPVA